MLICVVFVVLLVASVLASMRWLLCGGDGSKKKISVIQKKTRENLSPLRFLISSKKLDQITNVTDFDEFENN